MSQAGELKRQNFNVSPEQEAQIEWLRQAMGVATAKETILRSLSIVTVLESYLQKGYQIRLISSKEHICSRGVKLYAPTFYLRFN